MTTYYGVWSEKGQEWWCIGNRVFNTTTPELAAAQAVVSNLKWKRNMGSSKRRKEIWEARAIGEDGLPVSSPTEEQKRICLRAASHRCGFCEKPATNWVEIPGVRGYCCDEHEAWGQEALRDYVFRGYPAVEIPPKPRRCAMCGDPAKEYVDVHIKGWMCEQHKFVKLGCFSKGWPNDYVIDGSRKYVFCDQKGCWLGFPMEEEKL